MKIRPARRIAGSLVLPGDKSISHRAALIAAIADGETIIEGFASSKDCHSTLDCLRALGVAITESEQRLQITGRGRTGLQAPNQHLDAGNSGSTIRMLSGILAGQSFTSEIIGDESLCRRPMKRIMTPLRAMGATIEASSGDCAPLKIHGGNLQAIDYDMPMASAQVKSCVLLAGLYADGRTSVREPAPTRDHTEIMLREFGAQVEKQDNRISIDGRQVELRGRHYHVPRDISSAAFLMAAALMLPDSEVRLDGVGVNPTRRAIIDLLIRLGGRIELLNQRDQHGEPVADLLIRSSKLASNNETNLLNGDLIANLIDEIPIISVLATSVDGGLTIRDAEELRVKESDRIRSVVDNLRAMGAEVTEYPDGLAISGPQQLRGTTIDAAGDHRIAMSFAIAGLIADSETEISGSESVDISFPGFFQALAQLVSYE